MHFPRRYWPRPWAFLVFAALALVAAMHHTRFRQAQHLTGIPEWSCDAPTVDPTSPTGLAGGTRGLVAAIDDPRSLEWIAQTQDALAGGPWRVRTVDNDNAPEGRPTHTTLPHRAWLASLAWIDHTMTGHPLGLSVERAALFSDPLLHGLIVLMAGLLAGWRCGGLAGAIVAFGAATWFPSAGQFVAGAPGAQGLAWGCALASALLLVAGWETMTSGGRATRWFAASGVFGGLGLWVDAAVVSPAILGIIAGAVIASLAARLTRRSGADSERGTAARPWQVWALGGGTTALLAWIIEYAPVRAGLDVVTLHPLLGIAWLGAGDMLERLDRWSARQRLFCGSFDAALAVAGLLATAALPAALLVSSEPSLWTRDPLVGQLARMRFAGVEEGFFSWLHAVGFSMGAWAVLLPAGFVALAVLRLRGRDRAGSDALRRGLLVLTAGSATAMAWACFHMRVWSAVDALLLALAALLSVRALHASGWIRVGIGAVSVAASLAGAVVLWPDRTATDQASLPHEQITQLFERDLAHALRLRAGSSSIVVLAPPSTSASLVFHGGMRGVCSLDPENKDGFAATVRLVAATTFEEARTLIERRGITHLVFPSWDTTLDRYAGFGLGGSVDAGTLERAFIVRLRRGSLPDWLRAVPHQVPRIPGLERQAVAVFEVVPEQEHAEALSRLAEYYIESEQPARAAPLLEELQQYPSDPGVRAALVHLAAARGDRAALGRELDGIQSLLASGADEYMSWDRRLSLAVVLAQAKQTDAARAQLQRCLAEADEAVLRSATAGELFRLLTLAKRFNLAFPDASVTQLALQLLPPDFRKRL